MIKTNLHVKLAEKRMTQKELCDITGIRRATMSSYYNDNYKHFVKDHLDLICKALNCKIEDIIEYIPDEEQNK